MPEIAEKYRRAARKIADSIASAEFEKGYRETEKVSDEAVEAIATIIVNEIEKP